MMQIKFFKNTKLDDYTLIEGFPGAGLVGAMASSYMIEKLNMEYIGYIDSESFPPIAVIHNSIPMFPVRIYADKKRKLIIMISEFTIPTELVHELGFEIIDFIKKNVIKKVISIGGVPSEKPSENAFIVTADQNLASKATGNNIKPIKEGVIAGVSAIILSNSSIIDVPVINLLVEVNPEITDPKYAEIALTNLKKIIDIDINLDELEKEAKIVEAKIRQMVKKANISHESYKKATEATGPSMYA
ncbi:MAG: proteasome assembly chaperone family protein [Candidatus Micrarchaeia archaeon]